MNIILHNFLLKSVDKMTMIIFKFNYQFLTISLFSCQLSDLSFQ
ncbi:hypothetical protein VL20_4316 [Microcystis panniformis FACHB-1757]|uniref:Uncharacterized protein n=1 Tax=Microcystis panniformis FACHB-1757 TaxID=1638788 RepID=A0A0K1S5B7_9CHRO|nr:hypothetical protein VL20_4316 [Microcystis panniformis FACHB-1757]